MKQRLQGDDWASDRGGSTLRRHIWQRMTGRRSSTLRRPDLAAKSARGRTPVKDGGGSPTAERKAAWREGDGDDRHRSERGREREGARRQIRAERFQREKGTGQLCSSREISLTGTRASGAEREREREGRSGQRDFREREGLGSCVLRAKFQT